MLLPSRWIKILKDMWGNKSRSLLVILSIAVGIAAVGMINNTYAIVQRDLLDIYPDVNPASLNIYTSPFDEALVSAVESMREVEQAEGRRVVNGLVITGQAPYPTMQLNVLKDFSEQRVNILDPEQGATTPGLREVLLERKSAAELGVDVGDSVQVEMPNGQTYTLTVAGTVHDLTIPPVTVTGDHTAYLTMDTLVWMGQSPYFNRLDVLVADNQYDREAVLETGALIRDRTVEPSGVFVGSIVIPGFDADPGEYWAQNQMDGFLLILQVMSALAIFLSGGLVINTISAIVTQQIRQIGIMRSVGAVRGQLVSMYLVNVVVLSLIAFVVSIPLALVGSWGLGTFAAGFLNFDINQITLDPSLFLLMAGIGLLMPVLVALYPILAGTQISVYDAIYQQGLSTEGKEGWIERGFKKLKGVAPPIMLSLRNTFRKKARLAFTLITLTMAGAMFISVFSTRASLESAVDGIKRYFAFDAVLSIPQGNSSRTIEREALRIPGVVAAESWASAGVRVIPPGGGEGENLVAFATPNEDVLTVEPLMLEGRWLTPEDDGNAVINEDLISNAPYLEVGEPITLEIGEQERTFTVVGITSRHLVGPRVYVSYNDFSKLTGQQNPVTEVRVRTERGGVAAPTNQDAVAERLEERFDTAGYSNGTANTQHAIFAQFTNTFDIILIVLMVMAAILAVVGGLSLTGTMGMNVFERTREIGVLRAVGASTGSVRQVVVVEGVVVGLISWVLAAILSGPMGVVLAGAVVRIVMDSDLVYQYSFGALGAWLIIVIIIGVLSSLVPARNAAVLTVREVLDYE